MASDSRQAKGNSKKSSSPKSDTKGFSKDSGSEEKSRLPFEPAQNRKKPPKKAAPASTSTKTNTEQLAKSDGSKGRVATVQNGVAQKSATGIPEVITKRMTRRMALFCGIPTALGMLTFVVSYIIVSQHLFKLPTVVVFLVSLGFFGLGVLGLSYGALSASWDEDRLGSWLGWSEFRVNFGRTVESWRTAKPKN
jgi:cell wall-associated NlpC family hydrolase